MAAWKDCPTCWPLHHPAVVLLELGANDGLRGLPLQTVHDNLAHMITLAKDSGARVLLLGIRLPPNYGPRYGNGFAELYSGAGPAVPGALGARSCSPAWRWIRRSCRPMACIRWRPVSRGCSTPSGRALVPLLRH